MTDPSNAHDAPQLTDLPRPDVEELTAEEAQDARGGTTGKWAYDDESPKETVTFEYGGLQVHYTAQTPSGGTSG